MAQDLFLIGHALGYPRSHRVRLLVSSAILREAERLEGRAGRALIVLLSFFTIGGHGFLMRPVSKKRASQVHFGG